jgi:hypothetical protein
MLIERFTTWSPGLVAARRLVAQSAVALAPDLALVHRQTSRDVSNRRFLPSSSDAACRVPVNRCEDRPSRAALDLDLVSERTTPPVVAFGAGHQRWRANREKASVCSGLPADCHVDRVGAGLCLRAAAVRWLLRL